MIHGKNVTSGAAGCLNWVESKRQKWLGADNKEHRVKAEFVSAGRKEIIMSRQKLILVAAVGIALLTPVTGACDVTVVVGGSVRRGPVIAHPVRPRGCLGHALRRRIFFAPPARTIVARHPLHGRFIRIGPPCRRLIVPRPHCTKHVVVHARPTVTVTPPVVTVDSSTVTVWITNSNGSQTAVKLTRSSPGFTGPRGEWYPKMPTNEQLRMVYGF
jgi:hypothetical protein